jgi:tetratricopeptide (TPR) repeat protein
VTDSAGALPFDRYEHHLIAGGELLRQSRLDEAQRELLGALDVMPESGKALALLGLAYFRAGKFAEALPVYRRLVGLMPGDASHHLNLGLVLLKLGDADAAAAALEKSRDVDPSQGRAVSYLGLAYARGGRFPEAYQAFLTAGQQDLAREIADNLTEQERLAIEGVVQRAAAPTPTTDSTRFVAPAPEPSPPSPSPPPSAPPPPPSVAPAAEPHAADDDEPALELAASDDDLGLRSARGPAASPRSPRPRRPRAWAAAARAHRRRPGPRPPSWSRPRSRSMSWPRWSRRSIAARSRARWPRPRRRRCAAAARVAPGHRPPQPLSEFATTRLVRLEDGDEPFEISAGGVLIVRVTDKMFSRTEGVDVTGGQLSYEPASRRSRGQNRAEPFATNGRPLFAVTGVGHLVAAPLGGTFTAVSLDDDIFYLREDLVFGFEPSLRWENGHVPGSRERIPMVQFRGSGAVAFRTVRPLLSVKLAPERVLYVDATALAGWIGRVVPRAVTPADDGPGSELFVECSGEGVVLVEEEQAPSRPS